VSAIGGLLDLLGSGIAVILEYYAVLFVLALPFLTWRPRKLFTLAAILTVVMPVAQLILAHYLEGEGESTIGTLLVTGTYPAMIWVVFILVGLGVGRLDLNSGRVRRMLLAAGVALAVSGYALGAVATNTAGLDGEYDDKFGDKEIVWDDDAGLDEFDEPSLMAPDDIDFTGMLCEDWGDGTVYCSTEGEPGDEEDWDGDETGEGPSFDDISWESLATADPHSGTPFEVAGSTGVAVAVISLCLIAAERLRWLLYPLAATGAMALTAYSGHVIGYKMFENSIGFSNQPYLWFVVVTLVVATLWQATVGRGPLERLLTWSSRRAATAHPANRGRG
jgi:hypothetical protein